MLNHSGSTIDRLKIIVKWGTFRPWRTLGHVTGGQGGHKNLSPRGDWLPQSRLVLTLSITTEEAGAMGGSCQFHRFLALKPQGVENNQQTCWQVWTLLSPVPRLGKLHRLATREERGTQDRRPRVHQVRQQAAIRLWKIPTPEGHSSLSPYPLGQKNLLLPLDTWSQESLRNWIPSSQSSYSTPGRLSNLGSATSSLPACANWKFQRHGEKH